MNWTEHDNKLEATIIFEDFKKAFAFITEVAVLAENMNHHPTWTNTYNHVKIQLSTHDAGNIVTEKDKKLAKKISEIILKYETA